jgi:hypothetical protein
MISRKTKRKTAISSLKVAGLALIARTTISKEDKNALDVRRLSNALIKKAYQSI